MAAQRKLKHIQHVFGETKNLVPCIPNEWASTAINHHFHRFHAATELKSRLNPKNPAMVQLLWIHDMRDYKGNRGNVFGFIQDFPVNVYADILDDIISALQIHGIKRSKKGNTYKIDWSDVWDCNDDNYNVYDHNEDQDENWMRFDDVIEQQISLVEGLSTGIGEIDTIFKNRSAGHLRWHRACRMIIQHIADEANIIVKAREDAKSKLWVAPPPVVKPKETGVLLSDQLKKHIVDTQLTKIDALCKKLKLEPVDYMYALQEVLIERTSRDQKKQEIYIIE